MIKLKDGREIEIISIRDGQADAKAYLKKLSRVVYWIAKNTEL